MSKPAGVQLKRWFTYMVVLLLFVNIAAVAGSVVINLTVQGVASQYQPFAISTKEVEQHILAAQRDMFEYLSELSDSTSKAQAELDQLASAVDQAKKYAPDAKTVAALEEIKTLSQQYRTAISQLPSVMEGSRDWSQIEEIRSTAVGFGGQVEELAGAMARTAQAEIRDRNQVSAMLTTFSMWTFILVLVLSVVVLIALRHWWKRFQDLILGI